MSRHSSPAFTVKIGAYGSDVLSVSGLSGTERMSRPFDFRVDFFTRDGEPLAVAGLMGKDALVTVAVRDGLSRFVHGQVRTIESLGLKTGRQRYRAHVVPKLWRLTQVHRSRIFQGKSVPDILKAVLGEMGVEVRLALSGSYATREYCVQYRESDFAFLSRLMEWEGIFYFFEHTEVGHTLVLGDKSSAHAPLPQGGTLPLRPSLGKEVVETEYVSALEVVHRLRPGAVHLKDYDFEKPTLDVSGKTKAAEGVAALEQYDYPAGYVAPGVGKAAATVRQEEAGVGGRTLVGAAVAPRMTPGYLLEVESPEDGTFAGEYLITEVVHSGVQPDVTSGSEALQGLYRNQFQLLPKAVLTENDKDQQLGGYEDLLVKKNRSRTVEGNQQLTVLLDDAGVVEGNQTLLVQKDRHTSTGGDHDEAVRGNQAMTVGLALNVMVVQGAMESVGAAKATTIGGGYSVNVGLAYNEATGGMRSMQVGGAHWAAVAGSRQESIAASARIKVGGNSWTEADASVSLVVGKDFKVESGAKSYEKADGEAVMMAKSFDVKADKFVIAVGGKVALQVEKSGKVQFFGKNITLKEG
ncbi:type VI secretion system tip protein TssI/VgrG [Pyxidicoccus xibeiensis]|uniref:type VI secretion system tip protein TssI/VgrG n=1 Tax=Pyxidicoccus xibeiensis TaxID=2906759 RepID=UPI0020A7DE59|nr:type VI secretion system tip protein TssI/VgrG [Pyxidicoccus xibeiensis]MCP3141896.1 type VI secretion system tip protein VgrG [Pyxidicoccus xibeiensis]